MDIELITECSLLNALHHQTMDPRLTRSRLKLRKLYHSVCFKIIFTGSAFLLLFLLPLFLEYPLLDSSPESRYLTQSEESITDKKYFWSSIAIECLLLLALTVYATLRGFTIMPPYNKTALKQYFTSYRLTYYLYILALLISWPLWLASLIYFVVHRRENDLLLHIRQFVRPVFLIVQVIMIKKILKAIAYTSMQLIGIITLLFLVLFLFVMIGLAIFPHEEITNSDIVNEGQTYFNSTTEAFWNLLVYLTTANSPDFMTPAYSHNRAYFLYFGTFFFIANYLLLKVIVALYATRFMFFLEESIKRTYTDRLVNLAAAFQAITRQDSFNENEQIALNKVKEYAVQKLNLIDKETFDSLCTKLCIDQRLDWKKFKTLFLTIFSSCPPVEDKTFAYSFKLNRCKLRLFYPYVFCRSYINIISLPLAVIHVIVLTTLLVIDHKDSLTDQQSHLVTAMLFFSCLYIIELVARLITLIVENCELCNCSENWYLSDTVCKVMKWLFLGHNLRSHPSTVKQFLAITLDVLDILLLLSISVLGITTHFEMNSMTLFMLVQVSITLVILRMFRMVARIPAFTIMIYTLFHILIVLIPFVVLGYILYYQFAVIGIALFGHTNLTDTTAAQQYGTYENLDYYSYHFEDFGSTLVLLWNLMIVNNWHIITDAYVRRNSEAVRLYFITWWLITETVINGVVFGVLIEILLKMTKEFFKLTEKLKSKKSCKKLFLIIENYIWWGRSNSNDSDMIDSWNVYKVITFDEPEQEMEIDKEAIQTVKDNSELQDILLKITTDNNQPVPV